MSILHEDVVLPQRARETEADNLRDCVIVVRPSLVEILSLPSEAHRAVNIMIRPSHLKQVVSFYEETARRMLTS